MTDKQTQQAGADLIDAIKPASPVARAPFEPRPADECSGDVTADGGSCGGGGTVKADKGFEVAPRVVRKSTVEKG